MIYRTKLYHNSSQPSPWIQDYGNFLIKAYIPSAVGATASRDKFSGNSLFLSLPIMFKKFQCHQSVYSHYYQYFLTYKNIACKFEYYDKENIYRYHRFWKNRYFVRLLSHQVNLFPILLQDGFTGIRICYRGILNQSIYTMNHNIRTNTCTLQSCTLEFAASNHGGIMKVTFPSFQAYEYDPATTKKHFHLLPIRIRLTALAVVITPSL